MIISFMGIAIVNSAGNIEGLCLYLKGELCSTPKNENVCDSDLAMAAVLFLTMLDLGLFGSLRLWHWEIRIDEGGVMVFSGEAMLKN